MVMTNAERQRGYRVRCAAAGICERCDRPAQKGGFCTKHYTAHRKHMRESWRYRTYGLSPEDFLTWLTSQGKQCAICKVELDSSTRRLTPNVDHCHQSNRLRGILCGHCNLVLGNAKDDPKLLDAAAGYLRRRGYK